MQSAIFHAIHHTEWLAMSPYDWLWSLRCPRGWSMVEKIENWRNSNLYILYILHNLKFSTQTLFYLPKVKRLGPSLLVDMLVMKIYTRVRW